MVKMVLARGTTVLVAMSLISSVAAFSSLCGAPSLSRHPLLASSLVRGSISGCGSMKMGYPPEISYGKLPGAEGGGAMGVAEAWGGGQIALSQPSPRSAPPPWLPGLGTCLKALAISPFWNSSAGPRSSMAPRGSSSTQQMSLSMGCTFLWGSSTA